MRTTYLIAATATALMAIAAYAAKGGPNATASGPAAAPAVGQNQNPAPDTGVCPNSCTTGYGCGRGYCGGRGMNAQAGPRGPMAGRGMRTGPQDGTGPRRNGSCMGS